MAETCAICLELIGTINIAITNCNHKFHTSCLKMTNNSCPMCRGNIVPESSIISRHENLGLGGETGPTGPIGPVGLNIYSGESGKLILEATIIDYFQDEPDGEIGYAIINSSTLIELIELINDYQPNNVELYDLFEQYKSFKT